MEDVRRLVKALAHKLRQKISAPDFWGLVRKLENSNSGKPRVGYAKNLSDENIRFGQTPFMYLPASDIAEINVGKKDGIDAVIFTYFMGLLGINGPMPLEFTNYVYQRSYSHYDHTWRRFLDIINHRMHVLYYRAFAQNEQSICFDRPDDDPIQYIIQSLTGLPPNMNFDAALEKAALSYAANFSFMARNRGGLEDILRGILRTNVTVKDFIISSYSLKPDHYAILGNPKTAVLGLNIQIGRSCLSVTRQVEIEIGPIDFEIYQILINHLDRLGTLQRIVRLYLDRPLDCAMVVMIAKGVVSPVRLDSARSQAGTALLGYNCWIGDTGKELRLRIDASLFNRIERGKANKEYAA
ncbi:MAG: type VI secretion system baseplate subunit TssG [Spirochaetaceae bacterium]|jgi:type VI secretion system protein ImpH|nr:type VI secretion system baseplate subunit TssG [Spirochaetaceae bacterium]